MDFKDLYDTLYPNFFNQEFVKKLPAEEKFDELFFELKDFSENDLDIPVQGEIRYDFWKGDISNKTLQGENLHKNLDQWVF